VLLREFSRVPVIADWRLHLQLATGCGNGSKRVVARDPEGQSKSRL
jgi:hypothetical protein